MLGGGDLGAALTAGSLLALPLAFAGGLVAGLNPCCLALYPAAASSCCTPRNDRMVLSLGNAGAFVAGVALALTALGLVAVALGRVAAMVTPLRYLFAFVPIVMGLSRLGWLPLPPLLPPRLGRGAGGAFGMGLTLSLVLGPCGTPVLAAVLSYAALGQNFVYGAFLLLLYGIGNGLPLVAVGAASGGILGKLAASGAQRWIDLVLGWGLIALGLYLLWRL